MEARYPISENHKARSDFVRKLLHHFRDHNVEPAASLTEIPRTIVQFWNDLNRLPKDVRECIESWRNLEGFEFILFDDAAAREFIGLRLGPRYKKAYGKCYHPAMQSDYFRLCYILVEGGCYVDADDVYRGTQIEHLFNDGRLKIQPLCYDASTNEMVTASRFTSPGVDTPAWTFYFNNNPLIAGPGHPIVEMALAMATEILERRATNELPEIQSTTGPGNLTKSIFDLATKHGGVEGYLLALPNWEEVATSKWPLSYRSDARNWRLSNQQNYPG